jgi:hypothetical protein
MSKDIGESDAEETALPRLVALGYSILYGPEIAHYQPGAVRSDPGLRATAPERR